jgi:DNA gyrase subunit A
MLLQAFLEFRCSVIERRTRFKLSQALERKHIVEVNLFRSVSAFG